MITNEDLNFIEYKPRIYIGNECSLSQEIVRYTSISNLHLLLKGSLYVTIRKNFVDKRECGKLKHIKNKFRLEPVDKECRINFGLIDEKIEFSRNLYTSCWSLNVQEDVLMWKAYNASVRIKTTIKKLLDAITDDAVKMVICDSIRYKSEHPYYNIIDGMFCKDLAYLHEQEFRFYFDNKINNICKIKADGLIDNVLVSPFINRDERLLLEYIHNDFANLNIEETSIIE